MAATTQKREIGVKTTVYDVANSAREVAGKQLSGAIVAVGPSDRGVDVMVEKLRDRVRWNGRIALLRIHGVGGPDLQVLSSDSVPEPAALQHSRSIIAAKNFEHIRPSLARLRGCFATGAVVCLMGCEPSEHGAKLIDLLADLWGVVVTMRPMRCATPSFTGTVGGFASTVTSVF